MGINGFFVLRFERPQFAAARSGAHRGRRPSDLYGSSHLLRLLSRLDSYLNEESSIKKGADVEPVQNVIDALVAFLEDNSAKYFTSKNYFEPDEAYKKSVNSGGAPTA